MLPEQQQRILGYFIEEARDHLNTIEQGLLNLQSTLNDPEMVNEVFRAAHSIKGGAAMLGLTSIQQTSHRLEDCFKVLKENPIQVDQKLESLFLGVSDTLKALLEHLSGPFGLSEEAASNLMSETEPVFQWLNEHLEQLVQQNGSNTAERAIASPVSDSVGTLTEIFFRPNAVTLADNNTKISVPQPAQVAVMAATTNDHWGEFQAQVLQRLREMLQLFKQPATSESRQNLQECCQQLAQLGKTWNLPNWSNLCKAAANAIANPENTYLTLAKIVITEIKQAQELVLNGRESEIAISHQLETLWGFPDMPMLEIAENLLGDVPPTVTQSLILPETKANPNEKLSANTASSDDGNILDLPADSVTSLTEISEQLDPTPVAVESTASEKAIADNILFDTEDNSLLSNNRVDTHGPEVGLAELNTLADLFEGETPELDETWQQEEILEISTTGEVATDTSVNDVAAVDNDLADFLILDGDTQASPNITQTTQDLGLLFGDIFLEKDNLESEISLKSVSNNAEILPEITQQSHELPDSEDVIEELLSLKIDDNTQPHSEINPLATSENFDDLFSGTDTNISSLEEIKLDDIPESQLITPSENLELDNLFTDFPENPPSLKNELEISDLFDLPPITVLDFSQTDDNLGDFWVPEIEVSSQSELESVVEQDIAKALEDSLFAAAASGEIFGENIQSTASATDNLELEDFNLTFIQEFPSETEDNLFADLTLDDPVNTSSVSDRSIASSEIQGFSQQPEALDFIPEFTNQPLELPCGELEMASGTGDWESLVADSSLQEVDLEIIEFSDASTEFSLSDDLLALTNESTDIQLAEISDATAEFSLSDNLLALTNESTDIQLAEISDATAEFSLSDDFLALTNESTDIQLAEISDATAEFSLSDDFLTVESELTALTDDELSLNEDLTSIAFADVITSGESDENVETTTLSTSEATADSPTQLVETTPISEPTTENATPTADTHIQDEFADLETLLAVETFPSTDNTAIASDDFAALEALLVEENHLEPVNHQPPAVTPAPVEQFISANTSNSNSSLDLGDDFGDLEKLLAEADQTISHSSPTKPITGKISRTSTRRSARFEETMKVPVKQLDDMSNLVGELVVNRNTLEQDHERLRQSLDNLLVQVQQLSDVGARMQELYERSLLEASLLASRKTREVAYQAPEAETDRGFSELEMDRFTPFHTLSQEMIELIVRVRESASDIDFVTEETERVARQFRQVTTQLQEGLTRARMVPFSQTIDRLRRGVRDNAIKFGKQVELVIEGGDTLIDKMILDHLIDPLTHMLNNAIAHGIETPEVRQAAGKAPVGIITIRAFHQGNQTVISVGDDGAGIDTERIKVKAVQIGMMTPQQARTISRLEIYDLLFQAGFSTKDEADEISGRGVGMDVVRSEISEIRGAVNTDSAVGKGTTFTIRLPLTLSICKALCCVSDKARIAFPMDGVEDTLDIPTKNVQHNADGQSFISWRDTVLPFKPLKELLTFNRQLSRGNVYGGNRDDDMISVVVVRSGNTLIALQIDQVLSEQEIVIKQFESPAPKPIGVAGATVLGDGRIMPIADVLEIIDIFQGRMSKHNGGTLWPQQAPPSVPEAPIEKIDPTVLIVDDSITVRELLSLTFNKSGYRVEQARDGQEAWDKLRSGLPCDIVFCDIEMPRCDGLELLSRIQKDSNLNHLPIAMLTSRGADKHRQMAIQLGASGYFTKPYLEEALLEAAVRMLKGEKLVNT
ncbi:response regulator [Nostoc sp. TCL26-01]|uniref:hybrid sensor histidine kinase/response regulator n=1 Tax=Nostoc sp. TCL26-01 TaxID=2576904 RepID=UPI0015BB0E97|nr:response regulator [Nostoc sp. TCL26-01]QLE54077.1 response regulator [Nostoc sp. TCL26-01]